jgi:hypothetical protein
MQIKYKKNCQNKQVQTLVNIKKLNGQKLCNTMQIKSKKLKYSRYFTEYSSELSFSWQLEKKTPKDLNN